MNSPTKILRAVAVAVAAVLLLATPAQADILLEFDDLIFGREGSLRTVAEANVPADLVGHSCRVSVVGENQASVHPGNDLIVSTGDSQAVVVGVEDEVDAGIDQTFQLVVGPSIIVQLRFGQDEMSSLGFALSFDCEQPAPTTTDPGLDGGRLTASSTSTTSTSTVSDSTVTTTCADAATGRAAAGAGTSVADTPASGAVATDAGATTCPESASSQASSSSTTTTAPPAPTTVPTTSTTTTSSSGSSAAALPPSPVATAIVAAPAYAG